MRFLVHYYDGNDYRTEMVEAEHPLAAITQVEEEDGDNAVQLVVYLGEGQIFFRCEHDDIPVIATESMAHKASEETYYFHEFLDSSDEVSNYAS